MELTLTPTLLLATTFLTFSLRTWQTTTVCFRDSSQLIDFYQNETLLPYNLPQHDTLNLEPNHKFTNIFKNNITMLQNVLKNNSNKKISISRVTSIPQSSLINTNKQLTSFSNSGNINNNDYSKLLHILQSNKFMASINNNINKLSNSAISKIRIHLLILITM